MLSLFDLLELSETTSLVVQPELYKAFETEGIPSWTSLYNSKISLFDFFSSLATFFPNEEENQLTDTHAVQDLDIQIVLKNVIEELKTAGPSQ